MITPRTLPAVFALSTALIAGGALSIFTARTASAEAGDERSWSERAALVQEQFHAKFWDAERSLFRTRYPEPEDDHWHYWWQAHALDTLVDAYERSGEEKHLEQADRLYRGIVQRNKGVTIDYYDDMLWLALALLRLHDHTGEEAHRDAVRELWNDIRTGWNDHYGGGIAWRKHQRDYKNAPSNAPAVILAARLHQRFGDEDDLQWAKRIYRWLQETLVDPETGFVWDGINREGDGRIDKNWAFTYNQGVYIGASLELFRATGEEAYRREAFRTADASLDRLVGENGIFAESGSGDGGLFKGILVRYLAELIREFPDRTERYAEVLLHNAATLWSRTRENRDLLFAADWSRAGAPPLDLSVQLSGVMLVEQAARLSR